jgi:hypothetical protein
MHINEMLLVNKIRLLIRLLSYCICEQDCNKILLITSIIVTESYIIVEKATLHVSKNSYSKVIRRFASVY